jgi:hypothetical protein
MLDVLHRQWLTEHPTDPMPADLANAVVAYRDTAE